MNEAKLDPAIFVEDCEEAARDHGWKLDFLNPCRHGQRPWLQRDALNQGPNTRRIYISSGIHGDEVSGPVAISLMLSLPGFFADFDTTIFPVLNPDGLWNGTRENGDGIDLNRDYRNPKSAEIQNHIEVLKTLGQFDAAMMLHEDFEGIGAYLYELNDLLPPTLGGEIIGAMGRSVPIDPRPEIEDMPARGGVISRRDIVRKHGPIEERPEWPEAIYLSVHHTSVSYTTETPMPFLLEDRVRAQVDAVKTLLLGVSGSVR